MAPVVAIEFTDLDAKLVFAETRKGKRPSVRAMVTVDLPKPDEAPARIAQRAEAIRNAMKASKFKAEHARVVIPKNFVMARMVNLPSVVEDEIVGMARFEAERHIPFNADRHVVSHHVLAKQGMQGSDVMLTAVDQPIAQEYLDICVAAGLRVDSISVSSLSAFNAFAAAEPTAMADRVVAVVNIGRSATDLVVANNGMVNFTRGSTLGLNKLFAELEEAEPGFTLGQAELASIDALEPHFFFRPPNEAPPPAPVPVYDPLETVAPPAPDLAAMPPPPPPPAMAFGGEAIEIIPDVPAPSDAVAPENKKANVFRSWLLRVLQEVRRTYEFAHREFDVPMISHIYLCGEGSSLRNLSHYFRANFGIEASVFDPLRGVDVGSRVSKDAREMSTAYAVAVGALVSDYTPQAIKSNLLPPQYKMQLTAKQQQRAYITTGVLAVVALGMAYWYMADVFNQKQDLRDQLIELNQGDKKRVADLESKRQRLNIIRQNVQDDTGMLAVLEQLSAVPLIPDKVTLLRFEYKKADFVKISGHAKDLRSANDIVQALRNMRTAEGVPFFEDAKMDEGSFGKRQPRGRGTTEVLEYSATALFPKKATRARPAAKEKTDGEEAEEVSGS